MALISPKDTSDLIFNEDGSFTKECSTCSIIKPVEQFPKNKYTKNGVHSQCKLCRQKYQRKGIEKFICNYINRKGHVCGKSAKQEKCVKHNENSKKCRKEWYLNNKKKLTGV